MFTTLEAVLQADGALHFLEPVRLQGTQRVLVTFTQAADSRRRTKRSAAPH